MTDDIPIPSAEELADIRDEVAREQAEWDPHDLPDSQAQLAKDILDAGGPDEMVTRVGAGIYHDYVSPHPMPKQLLVADCEKWDLPVISRKAKQGEYDP